MSLRLNQILGGADIRSPIFYDSNDTSYYVDPASTSIMQYVRAANFHDSTGSYNVNLGSGNSEGRGLVAGYSGGSYGGIGYNVRHTTTGGSWIAPSTDTSTYLLFSNGVYFYYAAGGAAGRTLSYSTIGSLTSAGIFTVSGDVRAPLFYDSNNTAYYLDPASTSNLNVLNAVSSTTLWVRSGSWAGDLTSNGFTREIGMQMTGGSEFVILSKSGQGYTLVDGSYYAYEAGGFYSSFNSSYGAIVGFSADSTTSVTFNCNVKAPIYYDSNNTSYYVDPASTSNLNALTVAGGNATIYRDLIVNGGASGSFGNRIIVQGTATTYTLQDSTLRPTIYLNGAYPVVTLNHTVTNNTNHGPTIQFAFNGLTTGGTTSRQILIGASGDGNRLDFGFSGGASGTNSDYNPHNGIAGYSGITIMRLFNNGVLLGNTGAYPNQITSTSYALDVRGTGYSNTDFRAPIFYDSDNTGYYLNPAGSSQLSAVYANDWFRAQGNTGLYFQDKGYGITSAGAASNSYGNASTYGTGLNGWQGWGIGSRHCMMSTGGDNFGIHDNTRSWLYYWDGTYHNFQYGYLQSASSVRGPLFYDSDNTAYYCDPASTSNLNAITAAGNVTAAQYYTGGWFRNNSSGNGLYNESTTQHFYSDDVSYWNVASSSSAQGIRFRTGGHGGTVRGYVYANNGNDVGFLNNGGNWRARIVGGDYFLADGSSIRGQIFYDSNDTNYYCDPNSSSVLASVTANAYYPRAAVTESDIYAQSLSINAYHHGDSLTYDTFQFNAASTYETRATVGASFVSGTVETSIFKGDRFGGMSIANGVYQVRWTWNNTIGYKFFKTLYLGNSTNGNSFTVTIEASGNGSTWTTIATSTAMSNWPGHSWYNYAWNNNAYQGYIRLTITPSWSTVYGIDIYSMRYFCSYSLDAGSRLYDWDYSKNVTFAAAVSSPIFYDSNNTGYYVNPASQSKLNNLLIDTGSSNTSMTIVGSNQPSIFLKTTDNERNIEIFNSYGNFGIYRINAPSNYIIYHVDNGASSYTYFQLEGTARLTINSSGSTATTSVRSPIFYDSDNTAYFIDGAGTSNILGLTVNNTITGSVSGNAGTATTLQTARNINGTSFNGSANITTASWGTARTITIGATGKSVDGSANASWSLAEITGSQTANTFLAAPNGSAGNPTFRAIVAADIPTLNQNTTGTAANVTGTVAIANGGTGATTAANAATNLGLGTGNTPKFLNVFGERASVTASASTTVNTQFNVTELTMSASITTLTLSNIQANTIVHMWTIVTLGNGTGYSITWPAAIKWPGGTAPTITSTNAKRDIYQFVTYDGGTNIYAIIVGQNL